MKLTTYATKKRWNSFIRPDEDEQSASHTVLNPVYLKDSPISFSKPTFYIAASNFPETNYIIMENFEASDGTGRVYRPSKIYYWIKDIRSDVNNRWWVDCEIDLFATWKTFILNHSAFIEYASSAYNNNIMDTRFPQTAQPEITKHEGAQDIFTMGESYILQTLGTGIYQSATGMTNCYALDRAGLYQVKSQLTNPSMIESLFQQMGDITACLISLKKLPIAYGTFGGTAVSYVAIGAENLSLGNYGGISIPYTAIEKTAYIDYTHARNDFRRSSPYEQFLLYLPGIGYVDYSAEDLYNNTRLYLKIVLDLISGDIAYCTSNEGGYPTAYYQGNVAVDIPITQYTMKSAEALGMALSAATGLGIALAAGPTAMGLGAAAGALGAASGSVMNIHSKNAQVVGKYNANIMNIFGGRPHLLRHYYDTSMEPDLAAPHIGRPVFAIYRLESITGYCKTKNLHIKNSGYMTLDEQKFVEDTFNNTGVFITEGA